MVRTKPIATAPVAAAFEWDIFGWIWQAIDAIFAIDYLAPFQALFIMLCYCYLIYYTGMNLLSRSKYYINLSHNMIKWIMLNLVSSSGPLLDKLFKFNLLSRMTILVLTGLIVYPSRRMQRLHLSLAIRNKDKIFAKRIDDPVASGLSFFQKFLNSAAGMFLSAATLILKLIHPDNRSQELQLKVTQLYDTVKRKRYFLQLAESHVTPDLNVDIPGVTVNMTTSGVLQREPVRESMRLPDYPTIREPEPRQQSYGLAEYFDCLEVIQITKKKYQYFRDIKVRYLPDTNEIDIFIEQNGRSEISELEEVKVMADETLELVQSQKSRFIQFKNPRDMQVFLKPIIEGSKDDM